MVDVDWHPELFVTVATMVYVPPGEASQPVSVQVVPGVAEVYVRRSTPDSWVYVIVTPVYVSEPPTTVTVVGTTPATTALSAGGAITTVPLKAQVASAMFEKSE